MIPVVFISLLQRKCFNN